MDGAASPHDHFKVQVIRDIKPETWIMHFSHSEEAIRHLEDVIDDVSQVEADYGLF